MFYLKIVGATFHLPYNLKAHLIRQNKIIYQMVLFHQLSPHNGAQNAGLFVIWFQTTLNTFIPPDSCLYPIIIRQEEARITQAFRLYPFTLQPLIFATRCEYRVFFFCQMCKLIIKLLLRTNWEQFRISYRGEMHPAWRHSPLHATGTYYKIPTSLKIARCWTGPLTALCV